MENDVVPVLASNPAWRRERARVRAEELRTKAKKVVEALVGGTSLRDPRAGGNLPQGAVQLASEGGAWVLSPLGVPRKIKRTRGPAGVDVPGYKIDLFTGVATPTAGTSIGETRSAKATGIHDQVQTVRRALKDNPSGKLDAIRALRRTGLTFPTARKMVDEIAAGAEWYRPQPYPD